MIGDVMIGDANDVMIGDAMNDDANDAMIGDANDVMNDALMNDALMIGVLILVVLFRSSTNLASLYGISVTGAMVGPWSVDPSAFSIQPYSRTCQFQ